MKVAIVIGHNENTGARAIDGTDEWSWNSLIAHKLAFFLSSYGIEYQIFERDKSLGYTAAMKKHARDIKAAGCTHGIDLHFNYHRKGSSANGFEFLYWWASRQSRRMAQVFAKQYGSDFPTLSPRKGRWFKGWVSGAKMLWLKSWNKNKADQRRGAEICYYTHCPFIICEPLFASNEREWSFLKDQIDKIAQSYCQSLVTLDNSQ